MVDNPLRRLLFPAQKVISPFLEEGMTFIDLGCGGGRFSIEGARLVGEAGRVFAVDIQPEMLKKTEKKVHALKYENIVVTHLAEADRIGLNVSADFVLAMCMLHEAPDVLNLIRQVKSLLKSGGKFMIVEPRFHVGEKKFESEIKLAEEAGLKLVDRHDNSVCRACLLEG